MTIVPTVKIFVEPPQVERVIFSTFPNPIEVLAVALLSPTNFEPSPTIKLPSKGVILAILPNLEAAFFINNQLNLHLLNY